MADRLGHTFADGELLERALTHRSWCAEHPGSRSNERLEFLGDAVLGLVVSDEVFARFADAEEGHLSRARAAVVCAPALAEMAAEMGLGPHLLLGKGEDASGGRERPSILADAMEAVFGAIYLDGGYEPTKHLVLRLIGDRLLDAGAQDYKSRLHELAAREHGGDVGFVVTEHGPEHDKSFKAIAIIDGTAMGAGEGRSKKQAEQAAAEAALEALSVLKPEPPNVEPAGSTRTTESNDA